MTHFEKLTFFSRGYLQGTSHLIQNIGPYLLDPKINLGET